MKTRITLLALVFTAACVTSCQKGMLFTNGATDITVEYEYDNSQVKRSETQDLKKLMLWMAENPEAKIQLSAHTDQRGSSAYNLALSQKRAETAMAYLVEKGMDESRLVAKGYGEEQPLVSNEEIDQLKTKIEKEAAHRKNRRTEVMILNP